ncbi:hypothetical protein GCK32_012621 [Trichostrongylus colubriformis]|uniref:Patched domain-containing protein n=1 Tax=Trichostrongylus colubriformis TaxID=6319 RepID=A0AAN8G216_TRICO
MRVVCDWLSCHPRRTLLVVFSLLIPLFSYFVLYDIEIHSDVRRGFAQRGGRSIAEFQKFADFYNVSGEGLEIWAVLVTQKRSSGLQYLNMSMALLNEVERLDEYVRNTTITFKGKVVQFNDLHETDINYLFKWYKHAYFWSHFVSDINLTFPVGEAMGHKFFIGSHFFGVNKHKEHENGPIEQVEFVTLWYMSQAENFTQQQRLQALEMRLFELSRADNFSDLISFDIYGDQIANSEMLRGTFHTVKLFALGVVLMIIFIAIAFNHIAWKFQPILIIGAVGSPAIATATTFAILGWIDFPFNSIMCITPFLVMGIDSCLSGTIDEVWMNYVIICRGDLDWNKRAMNVDKVRKIIDSYPQFRTSLFDYDSTIYDLIITVKDELLKAVAITFVCMMVACAFMIPSFSGASVATLSMLSISFCRFLNNKQILALSNPKNIKNR